MSNILLDTFVDTNGVAISSHTPNTFPSTGWSQNNASSFFIQSNALQPNRQTDGDLAVIESGVSDFSISASVTPFNSSTNCAYPGVVFRYVDASNFWYVFPEPFDDVIRMYAVIDGVHNLKMEYRVTLVSGITYEFRIDCNDNVITFWLDGVECVSYVSTTHKTGTRVGFRYGKRGSPASPCSWDSLSVNPFSGLVLNWPLFTEHSGNPIVTLGASGAWDDTDVNDPVVIYDSAQSRYSLFYSGYKTGSSNVQALGKVNAVGSNLLGTWTKQVGNPVFGPSGGAYSHNGGIVKKGNTYYYYYGTANGTQISCATSTDLINWTDHGTVLTGGGGGAWDSSGVFDAFARLREDGVTIEVWYVGNKAGVRGLNFATTTDGLTLTKRSSSALIEIPPCFDVSGQFGEPSVYIPPGKEGVEALISFDATIASSNLRFIGQAITLDGYQTFHYRTAALVGSGAGWEAGQVFDSFSLVDSNVMYLFHGGTPGAGSALDIGIQIGVATAPFAYPSLQYTPPVTPPNYFGTKKIELY